MPSVGIGIITFNRHDLLLETVERVRALTRRADARLVVADDGSTDATVQSLRRQGIPVVTGPNRGIAWNKNRATFLLSQMLGCETIILLEDDAQPDTPGWEEAWIDACGRWGHVNYAAHWLRHLFIGGAATPGDPVRATVITAQCAAYTRQAIAYCGYFDPRFQGYGYEHVEHSHRLVSAGYGGHFETREQAHQIIFYSILGGVGVKPSRSHHNENQVETNLILARQLIGSQIYSTPWNSQETRQQFHDEIAAALSVGPEVFHLQSERRAVQQAANNAGDSGIADPDGAPAEPTGPNTLPLPAEAKAEKVTTADAAGTSPAGGVNLALFRPTRQSSVSSWSIGTTPAEDSARAVNGHPDQTDGFHTAQDPAPWWQVDLGTLCEIDTVLIHNRAPSADIALRAAPLSILLSDDGASWRLVHIFQAEDIIRAGARPLTWRPPTPETARHLRLQVFRPSFLHLLQVDVRGRQLEFVRV